MGSNKAIELKKISIGLPKIMKYKNDKEINTGICKQTTEEAFLKKEGFLGDGVGDLRYHGGRTVLYVYIRSNTIYSGKKNLRNLYHHQTLVRI